MNNTACSGAAKIDAYLLSDMDFIVDVTELPDGEDQNQEFQAHEQRHPYLIGQLFQDKPPTYVIVEQSTAKIVTVDKNSKMNPI